MEAYGAINVCPAGAGTAVRGLVTAILATALLSGAPAAAQSGVELTPFGGYRFGGTFTVEEAAGSYDVDDSPAAGLIVNWRHGDNTRWEIFYAQQDTDARFDGVTINDPTPIVESHMLQLGGTYQGPGDGLRPYLAMTLGGTHVRVRSGGSESDTFLSGSLGVGILLRPHARFGVRLEARGHAMLIDSGTDLFCEAGPAISACALRIEGDVLWQIDTFAGIVFRF